jgi:hypothetical protein
MEGRAGSFGVVPQDDHGYRSDIKNLKLANFAKMAKAAGTWESTSFGFSRP